MRWQPLHKACWAGDPEEVWRLLDAGADPNLGDAAGLTPQAVARLANKTAAASHFSKGRTNTQ